MQVSRRFSGNSVAGHYQIKRHNTKSADLSTRIEEDHLSEEELPFLAHASSEAPLQMVQAIPTDRCCQQGETMSNHLFEACPNKRGHHE